MYAADIPNFAIRTKTGKLHPIVELLPLVSITIAIPPQIEIVNEKLSVSFNPRYTKINPLLAKANRSLDEAAVVFTYTLPGKYFS